MATQNLQIILKNRPTGVFSPSETFASRTSSAPNPSDLQPGQILTETLYLSIDPVVRQWIEPGHHAIHIKPGEVIRGPALSRVIASQVEDVKVGDLVSAWTGWVSYAVVEKGRFEKLTVPDGVEARDSLGVLGYTGLAAYFGLLRYGKPKAGETVVVSAAAGAVGSVVVQLAKLQGAKVVGIAGGPEKGEWLKGLGVDEVVDYKQSDFEQRFKQAIGEGIDVYFDNVGGSILQMAIDNMKLHGRIIVCGDISTYNTEKPQGIRSIHPLASKGVTVHGFSILHHVSEAGPVREELAAWLREGKLKRTETVVKGGLEAAPQALAGLFRGENKGKMILEVKAIE